MESIKQSKTENINIKNININGNIKSKARIKDGKVLWIKGRLMV